MDNLSQRDLQIEKYISGEMTSEELRSFENEMDNNSELKEEVSFQKDVISALKMERKAALKARLNNVKIPSPYSSYYTAGIASVALISGIVFFSTFWPMEEENMIPLKEELTEIAETTPENSDEIINEIIPESESTNDIENEAILNGEKDKSEEMVSGRIIEKEVISENPARLKTENKALNIITPKAPEPLSDTGISKSDLDNDKDDLINTDKRETNKVEVEIKTSNDYKFHYQYYNNKLFLYGDFSKSPYELIELNRDDSKKLYMYFSGKYFALETNQMDIAKLSPIRDKIIIKGLDNLRLR
ncbi:hypothetical protein HZR84_04030 [Hyphobacterium sp. CCMP332]|nr:hypothetical protein HZR84_04030 [Hyphobacterium sp. CCMP332]